MKTYEVSICLDITASNKDMAEKVFSNVIKSDPHHPIRNLNVEEV